MYRTSAQIDSLMGLLAGFFPALATRVEMPETSVEGRTVYALRLRAGAGEERRGILLVGGTHSRELMNPDMLIELAVDVVVSYVSGHDIVLGRRTWPADDIKLIMETVDLYLIPCMNPDGRNYVMSIDDLWRKNRRDNPGTACDGVDLNRNLDLLWAVTEGQTSCSPCSDVYCGPAAFGEPETRNVKHMLDTYRIDCFADVHSYSELVLYPWSHAPNQTTNPTQRFTGLPSGTCQPLGIDGYREYIDPRDLLRFETVAQRIVDAIAAVRGRVYTLEPGAALYPTTGTHGDYVYARHIADPGQRKVYGYTLETGPWAGSAEESFHPADPEPIKREAESGVLALMQQCICAIELIGSRVLGREEEVSDLRRVRDELLGTTEAGREWIALFERVQTSVIGAVLDDEQLLSAAAELVRTAGTLVAHERAVLDRDTIEHAVAFVRSLSRRAVSDDIRADLRAVTGWLDAAAERSSSELIRALMGHGP